CSTLGWNTDRFDVW
nr:immunoglobulin heavy chain junction region [Macaca mulatta]MOV58525.1 immunoglobulin heavy chain junction region [Macaca mulatta]MOV59489.1 immunoglobulin heavy chain junction region [Macaca mulatta]